jgi:hypothetical protein
MFGWFRSHREKLLERDVQLLQARLVDAARRNGELLADRDYFRVRYEKLADLTLFRQDTPPAGPIHHDTEPAVAARTPALQIMRVGAVVGKEAGVDFTHKHGPTSAADLPVAR